ncbi:MAG: recombinase family protein [Proteobacteria bacterium]|nr:recombinase family protein [Pseudomonadota bacterium]
MNSSSKSKVIYPYVRFSKDTQAKGDSLRRQTEKINEYAVLKGYTVDNQLKLEDLGKSAYLASIWPKAGLWGGFWRP